MRSGMPCEITPNDPLMSEVFSTASSRPAVGRRLRRRLGRRSGPFGPSGPFRFVSKSTSDG